MGAILATGFAAVRESRFLLKTPARNFVRPVVGVLAGSSFTPELANGIASWWPAIALLIAYSLVMLAIGYVYFRKLGGYDKVTVLLRLGARRPRRADAARQLARRRYPAARHDPPGPHTVVIFLVPFALQIYLGHPIGRTSLTASHGALLTLARLDRARRFAACSASSCHAASNFPASPMILPMLFSMLVHFTEVTQAAPPPWLVAVVQVVLGSVIGARFAGVKWSEIHKVLFIGTGWALVLLGSAAVDGLFRKPVPARTRPLRACSLAFAPAGMVEMTLITFALGMETAFVVTCQLSRILFVLLITPLVFKIIKAPPPPPDTD